MRPRSPGLPRSSSPEHWPRARIRGTRTSTPGNFRQTALLLSLSRRQVLYARGLVLDPPTQQVRVRLAKTIGFRRLAKLLDQRPLRHLEIEQDLSCRGIAYQTSHPGYHRQPLSTCALGDPMRRGCRVEDSAAGGQLDCALAGRKVDDQLATVVVGGIREEQGEGHVHPHRS